MAGILGGDSMGQALGGALRQYGMSRLGISDPGSGAGALGGGDKRDAYIAYVGQQVQSGQKPMSFEEWSQMQGAGAAPPTGGMPATAPGGGVQIPGMGG